MTEVERMTTVCLSLEELDSASCPISASAKSSNVEDFLGWIVLMGVVGGLGAIFGYSVYQRKKSSDYNDALGLESYRAGGNGKDFPRMKRLRERGKDQIGGFGDIKW